MLWNNALEIRSVLTEPVLSVVFLLQALSSLGRGVIRLCGIASVELKVVAHCYRKLHTLWVRFRMF